MKKEIFQKKVRGKLELLNTSLGVSEKNKTDLEPFNNLLNIGEEKILSFINRKTKEEFFYEIYQLQFEEDRDILTSQIFLKKYNQIIKYLFSNYSKSSSMYSKMELFEEKLIKYNEISFNDIWKMCKDHECNYFLEKEEVKNLMRSFKKIYNKKANFLLTFDEFRIFLLHFSEAFFRKNPYEKSSLPLGNIFEEFLKHLYNVQLNKNCKIPVFSKCF